MPAAAQLRWMGEQESPDSRALGASSPGQFQSPRRSGKGPKAQRLGEAEGKEFC